MTLITLIYTDQKSSIGRFEFQIRVIRVYLWWDLLLYKAVLIKKYRGLRHAC
jgi:hypothetical protein